MSKEITRIPVPSTGPLVSTTYDGVTFTTPYNSTSAPRRHRDTIRRYLVRNGINRLPREAK